MTIVAHTSRLTLRHFTPADLDSVVALYSNPQVMALHPAGPMARSQIEDIFAHILHTYDKLGYGFYAVVLNTTCAVIGQCGLLQQELAGQTEVEIAYKLLPEYWNSGLASEAAGAIRDYGFKHFDFPRLISIVHPNNIGSQRVCEKNGMTRIKEATWHGIEHMHIYAIINPGQTLSSNLVPH